MTMPDIYVAPKKDETPLSRKVARKKVVKKKTASLLAAFVTRPKNVRFETQERKEKIVLLLRRHWITNLPWLLITGLMMVAPVVFPFLPILEFLPSRYQFISLIVWYLLTTAFAFEKFLGWFFNVNIITDERIIDIDFPSLLYRDISSAKIDQIQDISVKVGGFIRSLFDFGDVLIQTAGAVPEFCFEAVPHPAQVSKILNQSIIEEEKEKLEGRVK